MKTQIRQNEISGQDRSMSKLKPGRSMAPPKADLQAGDGFLKSTVGRGGENRPEDLRKLGQLLYDNHAPQAMLADLMNRRKNGDLIERYQSEVLGFSGPDGRIDPGGKTISAIRELKGREIVAGWYSKASAMAKGKEAEATPEIKKDVPQGLAISQSIGNGGVNKPEDLKALGAFLAQAQAPPILIAGLTDPRYNGRIIEKYQKEVLGFRNPDGLVDPGGKTLGAIASLQGREIVAGWFGFSPQEEEAENPVAGAFPDLELDVKQYWKTQDKGQCDKGAMKVIEGHKKDHPELYKEFGSINSNKTTVSNSLHLVWEKDHEKGTARKEGNRGVSDDSTLDRDSAEWDMAIRYIFACIRAGVPVLLALNHTYAYKKALGNSDKTTDHWVTGIGIGSDKNGTYISYSDPGTTRENVGTNTKLNRLYQTDDPHIWRDETKYANADSGRGSYTLVGVTLYSSHRGKQKFQVGNQTFVRKRKF